MMNESVNFNCELCGGKDFTKKEGFYFCDECGVQSTKTRDIEDSIIHSGIKATKFKIQKELNEEISLTSWECFNYLLRGLVEELINLGAKDDLKLTVLQLWSTYLKKSEVAFFDTQKIQLPKLGPCYSQRDAEVLYNHKRKKAKPKKLKPQLELNLDSTVSNRQISLQKKLYAQAEYEKYTSSEFSRSFSSSKLSSSTSGTTGHSIRLNFTNTARKLFKRKMTTDHMAKHEEDSNNELTCHRLKLNKRDIPSKIWREQLSHRIIFAIIYLGLNLIEDDIQLSDMLRFMREGYLSTTEFQHFFPENIAESSLKIINNQDHTSMRNVFLNVTMRDSAMVLCRLIGIHELKLPNLRKLIGRYCRDLCLPMELVDYCDRLLNFYSPEMKLKLNSQYIPCYEGRAMAYIIFLLKLVFGLDDTSEITISNSAKTCNQLLSDLNVNFRTLFVWEDWVQYIEMRHIILNQCHLTSNIESKTDNNQMDHIEGLISKNKRRPDHLFKYKRLQVQNLNTIFSDLTQRIQSSEAESNLREFHSTLTPYSEYLEKILKNPPDFIFVPSYMHTNHKESELNSFINPFKLKKNLQQHGINLIVNKISCSQQKQYVKFFRTISTHKKQKQNDISKIKFAIGEEEWLKQLQNKYSFGENTFLVSKSFSEYQTEKNNVVYSMDSNVDTLKEPTHLDYSKNQSYCDSEEQINEIIKTPRRNLGGDNIFENLSDDEYENLGDENNFKNIDFSISSFDYWTLLGKMTRINCKEFDEIKMKFSSSFLWLLEMCSKYLEIDEKNIYEELLCIEYQFLYNLEDINKIKNILMFKNPDTIFDSELFKNRKYYSEIW